MSFAATTLVAPPTGERAIASLKVGDAVVAYNPATGKASTQTVQHTFLNHDTNLLDVTLRITGAKVTPAMVAHSATRTARTVASQSRDETIHTTSNHPWLTADHAWEPAGFLQVGELVVEANGRTAVVVAVRTMPGAAEMWDLTVANVHTFAVGEGQFVVHNCSKHVGDDEEFTDNSGKSGRRKDRDRLRGSDAKRADRNVDKVGTYLNMTKEERWGFKDYLEDWKQGRSMPNDYTAPWKDLVELGRDYLREVRGEE